MNSRYGSRKFLVTVTSLALSFILAVRGELSAEWTTIVSTCNVAYHSANAYLGGKHG